MKTLADLVMPKLGLTMTEGTVAQWAIAPGASCGADDIVAVIETDKIAYEVKAPSAGTLAKVLVPSGTTVTVGTPIAQWELNGAPPRPPPVRPAPLPPRPMPAGPHATPASSLPPSLRPTTAVSEPRMWRTPSPAAPRRRLCTGPRCRRSLQPRSRYAFSSGSLLSAPRSAPTAYYR